VASPTEPVGLHRWHLRRLQGAALDLLCLESKHKTSPVTADVEESRWADTRVPIRGHEISR
jgi:hypothetical protein